jgi:hypothetical protein
VNLSVVVVALRHRAMHLDAKSLGCDRKAIDERVVRFLVRPHQELPLGAAAGNHISTAWNYVSR